MNTQALIHQARVAYSPLVRELRGMGKTTPQVKGYIAGLLVCVGNMPRSLALAAARDIVA